MNRLPAVLAALLLFAFVSDLAARPAGTEPPIDYQLEIDGKAHPMTVGEVLTVEIAGKPVKLRLSAATTRLFDNVGGVSFRYPANFAFAFDGEDPDVLQWSMDGDDCVIQIMAFENNPLPAKAIRDMVAAGVQAQFDGATVEKSKGSLQLGDRKHETVSLRVGLGGVKIGQDIAAFTVGERTFVFVLQDSLTEDNRMTEETAAVRKLLAETFRTR